MEWISKAFISEQPEASFAACHAASCIKDEHGNLMIAYFAGSREGAQDVGIWLSCRMDGVWQAPRRIKYIYGLPHWNPILHRDGDRVLLYYKVGHSVRSWYTMVSESCDFGKSWTESREAIPGDHKSRVVTKNKILVTEDGRWLAGNSLESEVAWDSSIEISYDSGQMWEEHPIFFDHSVPDTTGREKKYTGVIQPALWQSSAQEFHCVLRSTEGRIYRSDSTDGGRSWCEAYPTDMPNNNSGITVARLKDGRLLLVYNPIGENWGARTPLSVALSEDNGKTFARVLDLETAPGEYSYPYVIEDGDGICVVYTWNRKNIVCCELQPSKQGD